MNKNVIKITDTEAGDIEKLKNKISKTIFDFGQLQLEKMEIDRLYQSFVEKDKKLRENWVGLQQEEKSFVDKLIQKYGEGDLDMESGIFTPSEK